MEGRVESARTVVDLKGELQTWGHTHTNKHTHTHTPTREDAPLLGVDSSKENLIRGRSLYLFDIPQHRGHPCTRMALLLEAQYNRCPPDHHLLLPGLSAEK